MCSVKDNGKRKDKPQIENVFKGHHPDKGLFQNIQKFLSQE